MTILATSRPEYCDSSQRVTICVNGPMNSRNACAPTSRPAGCLADDVVGDIGHGQLEVVGVPGAVVGQRHGQCGTAVVGMSSVSLLWLTPIPVQTPSGRGSERCEPEVATDPLLAVAQTGENVVMTRSAFAAPNGSDDEVFRELIGPYVAELHLHCYRLLGSVTDADDILQEVLIGAWRGWEGFAGALVGEDLAVSHRYQPLPQRDPRR